jgi:Rrf2 family protein
MLSKKAQYAFRALTHLVEKYDQGPVLISEISKKKKVPLKFLENILLELKKAGVLESKKGKGGGYYLKNHPSKTHMANIDCDGPDDASLCKPDFYVVKIVTGCCACQNTMCYLVRDATLNILEHRTLQDLTSAPVH